MKKYRYYRIDMYEEMSQKKRLFHGIYFVKENTLINWYIDSQGDHEEMEYVYEPEHKNVESNLNPESFYNNPELFIEILTKKYNDKKI